VLADSRTAETLIEVAEALVAALGGHDGDGLRALFALDEDVAAVLPDVPPIRGRAELDEFARELADVAADAPERVFSWGRFDVSRADAVAWLLADGWQTTLSVGGGQAEHRPCHLTIICEHRDERWVIVLAHCSLGPAPRGG
jgi:hypothetical protein